MSHIVQTSLSPHWRLSIADDVLRCEAGPDEIHLIAELSTQTLAVVQQWINAGTAGRANLSTELTDVQNYLASIGALHGFESNPTTLDWLIVGPSGPADRLRSDIETAAPSGCGELLLVVRTGGSLADLSALSVGIDQRSLLIDLTGHHTISMGPLSSPRLSACIGCYAGRLAERWGDAETAPEPASQRWTQVAAELTLIQLEMVASATSPLVNATINWDLRSGRSTRDDLLRYSACPNCVQTSTGRLPIL